MTVRLGVAGTGWWACFSHIPAVKAHGGAEIVAIADLDADRLTQVGETFAIGSRYSDVGAMLAAEALDGVIVATPHTSHAAVAIPALQAGAHTLVEKPMATTSKDAAAIVAAAERAGKQVLVPNGWNFRDYTAKAAELVGNGRIGAVEHVVCHMGTALDDLFAGQPMLETKDHMFRPPTSTWADPARAGGYGWGQLSHALAWIYRVTAVAPESVFCLAGKSPTGVDYFDAAAVRLANGGTMSLSGASTVPKHKRPQLDVRIFGTEGMLQFDVERERLELNRRDGDDEVFEMAPGDGDYDGTAPIPRFIDICAGNEVANDADARNGAAVVDTLDALYRSAASGVLEPVRA